MHIPGFDPAMNGIHDKSEPGDAMLDWRDLRLRVHGEPDRCQTLKHGLPPVPELALAVTEQRHIVHIPQIGWAAQLALDEVIERIQITVGPEL